MRSLQQRSSKNTLNNTIFPPSSLQDVLKIAPKSSAKRRFHQLSFRETDRHIAFVTGTRADFGKLEPLIVEARDSGFKISVFITGMHLLERYGMTKLEVKRLKGVSFFEFDNQAHLENQEIILSNTVCGFSDFLDSQKPDLVIVHGDRIEAMSCAIVCATRYTRCGHIEGGEISGTIDEALRHCNTKLAHHHFVSSEAAAVRVRRLGEHGQSIHVIGSPELDYHNKPSGIELIEVKTKYEIKFEEYGVCIFHPVTSELNQIDSQASTLFEALKSSTRNFIVLMPNNDPGCNVIMRHIEKLPKSQFRIIPSMRFSYFSELLRNAKCIVGNSSTGVREAPFLGVPSLNYGTRQFGRFKGASIKNVYNINLSDITSFLDKEWGKKYPQDNSFGNGESGAKFIEIICNADFWAQGLQKRFYDGAS